MTPNLEKLIPPIDEAGRAKRIHVEHKLLDRILNDLDDPELDHAEFRSTMRDYCELKKQDNLHEKNVVVLAIAEARLSRRPLPEQSRAVPSPVNGDSAPITDPNSPSAVDNSELDPDVDPEWSLAPWGRRKNGKPRTEKEYRTILYRTVRDVYGLELRAPENHSNPVYQPRPDDLDVHQPDQPDALSPSTTATSDIRYPTSDIRHSDESDLANIPPPGGDEPPEYDPRTPSFPHGRGPPHPPGSTEVSPFCRPDAPFDPKPRNPWYNF